VGADDVETGRAPYRRLAEELRREIAEGRLSPGDRLPSVRQLAERHGVASMTVQSALRELQGDGLIRSDPGRGTYVRDDASERMGESPSLVAQLLARVRALEERVEVLEGRKPAE
jgi:DNA-binding GntR family transcriptional regulator